MQTQYEVTLTGATGLILHQDNLVWAESLKSWRNDPANRKLSVAGDDRSPAWTWIGSLYVEADKLVIPADNLMSILREGGKLCPTGKGQKTFKAQSQSGLVVDQSSWPLLVRGREVPFTKIGTLVGNADFELHQRTATEHGFELFVKRAKIGAAKHVRVRPRFDQWSVSGTITVFDEMITKDVLTTILTHAGAYCGMGDWRPSSPKAPGPWGKFTAKVEAA